MLGGALKLATMCLLETAACRCSHNLIKPEEDEERTNGII